MPAGPVAHPDAQRGGELLVRDAERIGRAPVQPQASAAPGRAPARPGEADEVVAGEVGGVVECPWAVSPLRSQNAAEWPPTAQNSEGRRRAMANAPKPPIEIPPIATRSASAPKRSTASGMTSSST